MNETYWRALLLFILLPFGAQAQSLSSQISSPATNSTAAAPPIAVSASSNPTTSSSGTSPFVTPTQLPTVVVTANAEHQNRQAVDLSAGTGTYTLTQSQINNIAQGANTTFNQLLVRTPGVSDDTYGAIHFRNEDPFYRYYVNGTLLPFGINGFDQDIDTRFVQTLTTKIGALPAYYPDGNYGIIDIQTKTGASLDGSELTTYGGSFDTIRPTFSYGGTSKGTDFYFTGTYFHDDLGLENPTSSTNAIHDETNQYRGMAYISHQFEDSGRLSFLFSGSDGEYQIPNTPGQGPGFDFSGTTAPPTPTDSTNLNETQNEQTYVGFLAYQQTVDDFSFQISQTDRSSTIKFNPDVNGDLFFNGVASSVNEYILVNGLQADFSYDGFTDHTIRFGVLGETQLAGATTNTTVYNLSTDPADPNFGNPIGSPVSIGDNHAIRAYDYAVYLQDQWQITKQLTLNYGLRFEQVKAYVDDSAFSPRINAVYQVDKSTAVHAGWARYFDTPDLLNVSPTTVSKFDNTTNAADQDTDDPVKAERSDYFDVGASHDFLPGLQVSLDTYYKLVQDQIDDGQFGAANISSPYNIGTGTMYGAEFSVDYTHDGFSAYGNFSAGDSWGKGIVSSQFEFDSDELAASNANNFHFDQSQYYTASAGASYNWMDTTFHVDALYGDGIRAGFINENKLQPYYPVNLGIEHKFQIPNAGELSVRFDVLNLFDQGYILNDGTGIGEGAVKYGNRRGFYGGISYTF
jgi:outer membrane receptor protein involved in Fe transport